MADIPREQRVNVTRAVVALRNEMKELDRQFTTIRQCVTGTYEHSVEDYFQSACKNYHESIGRASTHWRAAFGGPGGNLNNREMRVHQNLGYSSLVALESIASSFHCSKTEQRKSVISTIAKHMTDLKNSFNGLFERMHRR